MELDTDDITEVRINHQIESWLSIVKGSFEIFSFGDDRWCGFRTDSGHTYQVPLNSLVATRR